MRLFEEQEVKPKRRHIADHLALENAEGVLNPELQQLGRARSPDDLRMRMKALHVCRRRQLGEEASIGS